MEGICQIGASNSQMQVKIDSFQQIVDNIKTVLNGQIDWADDVALSCVVSVLENDIDLLEFQKSLNKKEMSNLLVKALSQ